MILTISTENLCFQSHFKIVAGARIVILFAKLGRSIKLDVFGNQIFITLP